MAKHYYTEELAEFVHGLKLSDVPRDVIEKVKAHTIDQMGCALMGAEMPWNHSVRNYCLQYAQPGKCTVIGAGDTRIDAEFAAMTNATAGHGCEIDDFHEGTGHPGCVAIQAAIALAEEQDASGADYLLASIIGYEVNCRMSVAATESYLADRGFHNVSIFGVFSAAASASRLMQMNSGQCAQALSVAASHASGLHEYTQTGGEVKRLHAGIGAAGGIRAARLVSFGMTGPLSAIEGRKGFMQAFSAAPKPELVVKDLGRQWALMGCRIKPYACCGIMFQHIDALRKILDAHPLRPDEIKDIWVGVDRLSFTIVNTIGPEPKDMTGAQFSIHYTLGMTVVNGGNDFSDYLESARVEYKHPEILNLARRVRVELDKECDRVFPEHWFARVKVTTTGGQVYEADAYGKRPVSREEIEAKYHKLAQQVVPASTADAIVRAVHSCEKLASITELTALLRTQGKGLL